MRYYEFALLRESAPRVADSDDQGTGFYEPEDDNYDHQSLANTRKPKLTLRMVNRLKKIRSTKNLELVKKHELLGIMYGLANDGDDDV